MKVLIVAKTRQGSAACIGGITFEGRSVRLIAADAATNEHANLEYSVGEVWEVEAEPAPSVVPPHVENVIVRAGRRLGPMSSPDIFIERHMPAQRGAPTALYEGLVQASPTGALYISQAGGVPPRSTTFWRSDQPLRRDDDGKRIRYRYPTADGGRTLTFVGFQEPIAEIPAGTLLRVSLAHWWRPEDQPAHEPRCYVQLSGWFLTPLEPPAAEAKNRLPQKRDERAISRSPADGKAVSGRAGQEARSLLRSVFGHDDFWPLQEEIITHVLAGRDTLAIMPTGGGKSLCYQLPALLFDGLTVVISPLIALMQDQVEALLELGVPAAFLNSTLDYVAYTATAHRVRRGEIKLLFVAPETLLRPETRVLLDQSRVACFTIDEAHCISQWGHDFRPDYRQLLPVRRRYPAAVCLALTATATERVRNDIRQILGFAAADAFIASFDRPNLYLAVRPRVGGLSQVLAFLEAHRDQSGIIYASTRDGVDTLVAQLAALGWPALPYHAGMEDADRRANQRRFVRDEVPIMVATIAFGMGINKSNVRFILHVNLPADLESYYQQIGRAGRDGLRADCLLLYSSQDIFTTRHFIDTGAPEERAGREARLQAMLRYAQARACRRVPLLTYFDETPEAATCAMCDNCQAGTPEGAQEDVTDPARLFLTCVQATGQMFGAMHIINVLRGSQAQEVLRRKHDRLPVYGQGRDLPAATWRRLAQEFIGQGLLVQDMGFGGLKLGPEAKRVMGGGQVLVATEPATAIVAPAAAGEISYDADLFNELRDLRRQLAAAANVPPYVVFSDRTLQEMATYFPQSAEPLLAIDGVGRRKLEKYGAALIGLIAAYCQRRGLAERAKPAQTPMARATRSGNKRRFEEVGEFFAAGHSVADLQQMYGVTLGTIVSHLAQYAQAGGLVDGERVLAACALTPADRERVFAAIAEHGPERLAPIHEALGGTIDYAELHLLRLVWRCRRDRD